MTLSRQFWMGIRQALLAVLNLLEIELGISPTTAEIRKRYHHDGA